MANSVYQEDLALWHKHHANVAASLDHRLAIARAKQDQTLIDLLEQEQKQILGDSDRQGRSLQHQLSTLWEDLTTWIRGDSTVQVWQTVDSQGDRWWCAYNPKTGQSLYADSETEMRFWIEQNYVTETY
jgi:hypothetical protein